MFVITGLTSVASADIYRGWICNITCYPENEEYQFTGFSLIGTVEDDDSGAKQPYNLKNVKLTAFTVFPTWIRLLILMLRNHLNMPLFVMGIIVE